MSKTTLSMPVTDVRGALLVGSMPLPDSAAVFTFAAQHLGRHLKRIPDGETGSRINWTQWQVDVFAGVDALESEIFDAGYLRRPKFRLKPGKSAEDVVFPPLGYARAARASYQKFKALRRSGMIAEGTRFQVCLPTPVAPVIILVFPEHQRVIEPRYEAAMLKELDEIVEHIPLDDLSIQWDTAIEFAVLEGVLPHSFDDPEPDLTTRLIRLGDSVPRGAELGFHLCYGDSGGRHFRSRLIRRNLSQSPIAFYRGSCAGWTGCTFRCRKSGQTKPISRRSGNSTSKHKLNFISASFTWWMVSRERERASR